MLGGYIFVFFFFFYVFFVFFIFFFFLGGRKTFFLDVFFLGGGGVRLSSQGTILYVLIFIKIILHDIYLPFFLS